MSKQLYNPSDMTNKQIHDLFSFLIREADIHNLPEIKISVARARTILADLKVETAKPTLQKTPAFHKKLDRAFGL
jgi:hypothetical protein